MWAWILNFRVDWRDVSVNSERTLILNRSSSFPLSSLRSKQHWRRNLPHQIRIYLLKTFFPFKYNWPGIDDFDLSNPPEIKRGATLGLNRRRFISLYVYTVGGLVTHMKIHYKKTKEYEYIYHTPPPSLLLLLTISAADEDSLESSPRRCCCWLPLLNL